MGFTAIKQKLSSCTIPKHGHRYPPSKKISNFCYFHKSTYLLYLRGQLERSGVPPVIFFFIFDHPVVSHSITYSYNPNVSPFCPTRLNGLPVSQTRARWQRGQPNRFIRMMTITTITEEPEI